MTKSIKCLPSAEREEKQIRVKVIKAPLVDTQQLRRILFDRARALVL